MGFSVLGISPHFSASYSILMMFQVNFSLKFWKFPSVHPISKIYSELKLGKWPVSSLEFDVGLRSSYQFWYRFVFAVSYVEKNEIDLEGEKFERDFHCRTSFFFSFFFFFSIRSLSGKFENRFGRFTTNATERELELLLLLLL